MDGNDDVDEDELALAMSTELSRPPPTLADRRTRSFTSLQDAEANPLTLNVTYLQAQVDPSFLRSQRRIHGIKSQLTSLDPKPIRIYDRSLDNQDKDNPDGLWASNVTVTEPSIVKGNQRAGLQAVSGYVGS